jgi:hypothetical protein
VYLCYTTGKNTYLLVSTNITTPAAILHRTALPLVLFAVVWIVLLFATQLWVLPALLSVEIAGDVRNVQELKTYYDALNEQIQKKQEQRMALLLPMHGSAYRNLTDWKQKQYAMPILISSVSQVAKVIRGTQGNPAVYLQSIRYFPIDSVLEIDGNVRNVGPRSMTVLAQFIEELRQQAFVESINHPTFTRLEDASLGFYSPFHLTVTLQ